MKTQKDGEMLNFRCTFSPSLVLVEFIINIPVSVREIKLLVLRMAINAFAHLTIRFEACNLLTQQIVAAKGKIKVTDTAPFVTRSVGE